MYYSVSSAFILSLLRVFFSHLRERCGLRKGFCEDIREMAPVAPGSRKERLRIIPISCLFNKGTMDFLSGLDSYEVLHSNRVRSIAGAVLYRGPSTPDKNKREGQGPFTLGIAEPETFSGKSPGHLGSLRTKCQSIERSPLIA